MVKLYSYSSKLNSFVEVKWMRTMLIAGWILIGVMILIGVVVLNQSIGPVVVSHSSNALAAENDMLRQQASLISSRLNTMELQTKQLQECALELQRLHHRRKIVRSMVSSFTNTTIGFEHQSRILAVKSIGP